MKKIKNRWQVTNFNIQTPIGRGTIVGMTPDRTRVLVMHTYLDKKGTYARWWDWNPEKGEVFERDAGTTENNTRDGD
jgi:hypothetical protein